MKAEAKDQAPDTLGAIQAQLGTKPGGERWLEGGTVTKQRYTAHCEWEETGWWVVTVRELPGAVTQSRRLDQVPGDVAEVIQLLTDEGPEAYELDVVAHVPGVGWRGSGSRS